MPNVSTSTYKAPRSLPTKQYCSELRLECTELHRRSQDFQRVGAPRGGSMISDWGDDGEAEGPERGAVGAKRRSAEGSVVWGEAP